MDWLLTIKNIGSVHAFIRDHIKKIQPRLSSAIKPMLRWASTKPTLEPWNTVPANSSSTCCNRIWQGTKQSNCKRLIQVIQKHEFSFCCKPNCQHLVHKDQNKPQVFSPPSQIGSRYDDLGQTERPIGIQIFWWLSGTVTTVMQVSSLDCLPLNIIPWHKETPNQKIDWQQFNCQETVNPHLHGH